MRRRSNLKTATDDRKSFAGRIEICGGIASGKTTLARLLENLRIHPILEDFQSNPFWKPFYADPVGNAFETEITFLLQHFHEIKKALKLGRSIACDFSPILDLAYAHVTLGKGKQEAFIAVFREVLRELKKPNLLIHLVCAPKIQLDRIQRRGREVEKSISVTYLEALNRALVDTLSTYKKSWAVLTLDSGVVDFSDDEKGRQSVLKKIMGAI